MPAAAGSGRERELERLYAALSACGMPVDLVGRVRVEHVLRVSGVPRALAAFVAHVDADEQALSRRLRALLARSPDEAERLREVYRAWVRTLPRASPDVEPRTRARRGVTPVEAGSGGRARAPVEASARRVHAGRRWIGALALLGLAIVAIEPERVADLDLYEETPAMTPDVIVETPLDPTPAAGPVERDVEVEDDDEDDDEDEEPAPLAATLLGLLGLALIAGDALARALQPRLPPPHAPLAEQRRRGRYDLGVATSRESLLIGREEQDELIWGIEQLRGEERTRALDVERSVHATASAGGVPTLHFERARAYRGVWIWIDRRMAAWRDARQLADDITGALARAGLPAARVWFDGVPDQLELQDGSVTTLQRVSAARRRARIVVLTDGRDLALRHADDLSRARVRATLRELEAWDNLAFVGFGGARALALLLHGFGLRLLRPADAVPFLAGLGRAGRQRRQALGPAFALWEASCAIAPRTIGEDEALTLRRALALDVEPWAIARLRERAPGPSGKLRWSPEARAECLYRYERGERSASAGRLARGGALAQAIEFWRGRYAANERYWRERSPGWIGSRAWALHRVERAELELWVAPAEAARALYQLHEGDAALAAMIRRVVAVYDDGDAPPARDRVRLPWRLRAQPRDVRRMLGVIGFAPAAAYAQRAPGLHALRVAGGLCAFAAVGALIIPRGRPAELYAALAIAALGLLALTILELRARHRTRREGASARIVSAWVRAHGASTAALVGALLIARWPSRVPDSIPPPDDEDVHEDAAPRRVEPPRARAPRPTPPSPLPEVVAPRPIETPDAPAASEPTRVAELAPRGGASSRSCPDGQVIRDGACATASPGGGARVEPDTHAPGMAAAAPPPAPAPAPASAPARPASICPVGQISVNGVCVARCPREMAFVPGGSLAGRTLADLCLDRTEVTVAAYARCVEAGRCAAPSGTGPRDNWGRSDRARHPINDVTWTQARAFCRAVGKRLPTEWEWEWAARGREEGRPYPWGAQSPSCAYAIMEGGGRDGCGRGHTAPVASRPRGVSRDGVHDLSGNVWEWTASGNAFGYVVRGGSLANKRAWRFQSAFRRLRLPPRRHDYATGFRCARAPSR